MWSRDSGCHSLSLQRLFATFGSSYTPNNASFGIGKLDVAGRHHPRFKDLNLATRVLLGKGRACMRQIFLGQGPREEVGKGLIGNTILLSQAEVMPTHILPALSKTLDSFSIFFCRSVDDVKRIKALVVNRVEYLECLQLRKKIRPVFSTVDVDVAVAFRDLPEKGVPDAFVEALPEAESLQTVMPGPASRGDPLGEGDVDEEDEEKSSEETPEVSICAVQSQAPETLIGIYFLQDPKPVQHFEAMRAKLELLNKEGQQHQLRRSQSVEDVTAAAGSEEHCKRIVLDVQHEMKKCCTQTKAFSLTCLVR